MYLKYQIQSNQRCTTDVMFNFMSFQTETDMSLDKTISCDAALPSYNFLTDF